MSNPDTVLDTRGLAKAFQTGKTQTQVLQSIDLVLEAGSSISIRGESGSGKTTLLNILAGIETPDDGQLFWGVREVSKLKASQLATIRAGHFGLVFQAYYLIPELTLIENVLFPARLISGSLKNARKRAMDLLGKVGLADRAKDRINVLSGGERQRVAIARALINQPQIILADEPTGNLDEKTSQGVMDQLHSLCSETGASLILVTHNPEHARQTDQSYLLHLGKLEPISS